MDSLDFLWRKLESIRTSNSASAQKASYLIPLNTAVLGALFVTGSLQFGQTIPTYLSMVTVIVLCLATFFAALVFLPRTQMIDFKEKAQPDQMKAYFERMGVDIADQKFKGFSDDKARTHLCESIFFEFKMTGHYNSWLRGALWLGGAGWTGGFALLALRFLE